MTKVNQFRMRSLPLAQPMLARTYSLGMRLKSIWSSAVNLLAPIGYEDATGFHYGIEPYIDESAARAARRN